MDVIHFILRAAVYIISFIVTFYAAQCIDYEKMLKPGHVRQAQVFWFLLVMAVSYLAGSFLNIFIYN